MTTGKFPITFRKDMIEAGLAGRKRQTRRLAWKNDKPTIWRQRHSKGLLTAGTQLWVRGNIYHHDATRAIAVIVLSSDAFIQKLQNITEADCRAELGVDPSEPMTQKHLEAFIDLWQQIYHGREGFEWHDNPDVVVMPHVWRSA